MITSSILTSLGLWAAGHVATTLFATIGKSAWGKWQESQQRQQAIQQAALKWMQDNATEQESVPATPQQAPSAQPGQSNQLPW